MEVATVIWFLIGMFTGSVVGVVATTIMVAASREGT